MYFRDYGIASANLDGTGYTLLTSITNQRNDHDVAVDPVRGKVFYYTGTASNAAPYNYAIK